MCVQLYHFILIEHIGGDVLESDNVMARVKITDDN
jgi:hypothetical protein